MLQKTSKLKIAYLFYITFFALYAIFPVLTDYVVQTYNLLDIGFLTPPSLINVWILITIIALLSCSLIFYSVKNNQNQKLEYFSVSVLRYSLAFVMLIVYAYCKMVSKQFQIRFSALEMPLKDVSDFDLTWYFYGRSNAQTFLLGCLEFIAGILLLSKRTTLLGALLLLPITANIMLLDNFNDVGPHLNVFSILFFLFDIGILLFYVPDMVQLYNTTKQKLHISFNSKTKKNVFLFFKILFILLVVYRFGKGFYGATQIKTELSKSKSKCFGIFQLQNISINNKTFKLDSLSNYWKKLYFEKIDSRDTRLKDKHDSIINIFCEFHNNPDSITITSYTSLNPDENPINPVVFKGTYMLSNNGSILTLHGLKNDTLTHAIYKKITINGYDWWW